MTQGPVSSHQLPPEADSYQLLFRMYVLLSGVWVGRMIHAVTELGIADALPEGTPVAVDELAAATDTDPDALHRVLRALTFSGIFASDGDRKYLHTDLSKMLRRDHPASIRNVTLMAYADWHWQSLAGLTDSIRSGKSAFAAVFGKDMFAHFHEDDPAAGAVFQQAMTDLSAMEDGPLAAALDIADAATVVDVGGGHGNFLSAVVDRYPGIDAVLFESAATLHSLTTHPRAASRMERFTLHAGDLRTAVDRTADVYLLKKVIHLFDDETAVRILRNCAASANPDARVVVMERVITDGPESVEAAQSDVQMLLLQQNGRERTEQEYVDLFERAGLHLRGITPTMAGMCLLEAAT